MLTVAGGAERVGGGRMGGGGGSRIINTPNEWLPLVGITRACGCWKVLVTPTNTHGFQAERWLCMWGAPLPPFLLYHHRREEIRSRERSQPFRLYFSAYYALPGSDAIMHSSARVLNHSLNGLQRSRSLPHPPTPPVTIWLLKIKRADREPECKYRERIWCLCDRITRFSHFRFARNLLQPHRLCFFFFWFYFYHKGTWLFF